MSQSHSSRSIPVNTVLGERYKVTDFVTETADGDSIFEGKDTVLNRKVSIVVASTAHNDRLITNARTLVTNSRAQVQVLDLGNTSGRAYLVTSFSRPDALLDTLLVDSSTLAASSESQEALGEEIFGDDEAVSPQGSYTSATPSKPQSISATREVESQSVVTPATAAASSAALGAGAQADDYDAYEDDEEFEEYEDYDYADDEAEEKGGGIWAVAIAAVLLLVAGVAIVFSLLNGMINKDEEQAAPASSSASPSASSSETATASPSASPSETQAAPARLTNSVTRLVPANPTFMADQDRTLGQMTDGNEATNWMSYGFATANFGGATDQVALAFELEEKTPVSELTIQQQGGTGGAFTVLTNDSASLDGATEVGSGSFNGSTVQVPLDKNKQGEGAQFVIVRFTEAPQQATPIANYNYGLRISEISVSN